MRKTLLLIILISTSIIFYGCSENSNEDSPVSLLSVDINSLNNKKILDIVYNDNLMDGVYQIVTTNNNYIFFNGIKNEYSYITLNLEDKTLIINCKTISSSKINKKLYVIREKSNTSSNDKSIFFDTILLKINDKKVPFNSIKFI